MAVVTLMLPCERGFLATYLGLGLAYFPCDLRVWKAAQLSPKLAN